MPGMDKRAVLVACNSMQAASKSLYRVVVFTLPYAGGMQEAMTAFLAGEREHCSQNHKCCKQVHQGAEEVHMMECFFSKSLGKQEAEYSKVNSHIMSSPEGGQKLMK
jgi:hypothetical protein